MPRLSGHVNVEALSAQNREKASAMGGGTPRPEIHSLAFASRFTDKDIPKYEMPQSSTPANAVYQLIKDELELEGKPIQNMATFVATWMEPEAEKLMTENLGKNFVDKEEYPQTVDVQDRCVNMLARLYNAPKDGKPTGTSCVGSSEAIMLGCLAAKFRWRKKMQALGKPTDKPNIVFGTNAHVVVKKFARYFDVEPRAVPIHDTTHYMMEAKEAVSYVDENTICVFSILGSTFTGHFEKVKLLSRELDVLAKEKGYAHTHTLDTLDTQRR
jgi:glutamate decarboxylase